MRLAIFLGRKRAPLFLLIAASALCLGAAPSTNTSGATSKSGNIGRTEKEISVLQPKPDKAIARRLEKILAITGWFQGLKVTSQDGVVTIFGKVKTPSQRDWALKLAQDTTGVVAVIDKTSLIQAPWFDLDPTKEELKNLTKKMFVYIPHLIIGIVIFLLSFALYRALSGWTKLFWYQRLTNPLLTDLMSRIGALPILLVGLYLVMKVLSLTGLAMTILGGTGALGLVAGFAFNNILQNYFSGIMLSLRRPFIVGDVIQVAGQTGVVYSLSSRGTTLVDFDGNHIFIPNATIISSIIKNQSASPRTRIHLSLELIPKESADLQQQRVIDYLHRRPDVLKDPLPEAHIADNKLEIYFWINVHKTSSEKLQLLLNTELRSEMAGTAAAAPANGNATQADTKEILKHARLDEPRAY